MIPEHSNTNYVFLNVSSELGYSAEISRENTILFFHFLHSWWAHTDAKKKSSLIKTVITLSDLKTLQCLVNCQWIDISSSCIVALNCLFFTAICARVLRCFFFFTVVIYVTLFPEKYIFILNIFWLFFSLPFLVSI